MINVIILFDLFYLIFYFLKICLFWFFRFIKACLNEVFIPEEEEEKSKDTKEKITNKESNENIKNEF